MPSVVSNLQTWAVEEMGYTGPWSEDMAVLCTGPMAEVWEWVVEHCKNKEKVKMIQGNLALARRKQGGDLSLSISRVGNGSGGDGVEREELLAERGRLIGELHGVLAKIEKLRGVVNQHNKDRGQLAMSKQDRVKDVKERQQRTVLLGLYVKQVTNFVTKLDGLAHKLELLAGKVDEKGAKGEKMFSSGGGLVETESGKNVREAVQVGVEHKKTTLAEGIVMKERRGEVRSNILQLVGDLPAAVIMNCLVEQTIDLTHQVKKKVESVDLVRDAKVLQKEEGEKDNEFLSSVKREVGQFYKRHVTSQIASTNLATSIDTWQEKAKVLREKISVDVSKEEEEKARLKGIVASYRSSMDSVKSSLAGIEMSANRHPMVDTVKSQQDQIEQLGQVISVLISNASISHMRNNQSSTLSTMNTTLPLLASEITTLTKLLKDEPSNHLSILGSAPTSNLSSTLVGGTACSTLTPTSQLAIHRRSSGLPQIGGGASEREDTVMKIVKLIMDVDRRERELAHTSSNKVTMGDKEVLDMLEMTLTTSIREQGRNLGPVIEESVGMRGEAGRIIDRVEKLHGEWCRQPGGEVAMDRNMRWGEVEGRSLQQWIDLVRVTLTKLYANNNG